MTLATRRAPPEPEELEPEVPADHHLRDGLVLLGVALIVGLALVAPSGAPVPELRDAFGFAVGWAQVLVPIVIAAYAVANLREHFDLDYSSSLSETIGLAISFVGLDITLQVVDGNPITHWGSTHGGGMLGQLGWTLLTSALGTASAAALVAIVVFTGVAMLFDITVDDLLGAIRNVARWLLGGAHALVAQLTSRRSASSAPHQAVSAAEPREDEATAEAIGSNRAPDDSAQPQWQIPPITMLQLGSAGALSQADLAQKIKLIEDTLADFDVFTRVVQVNPGPTLTQFGLEPGFREKRDRHGVVVKREKIKVSEITALNNDLALALAAPSIRIEAPVPGRTVVGLEIPNGQTSLVSLRQVAESTAFQKLRTKTRLAVALGEDVSGQPVAADLAKMPHLLIAGATGTGKSVCMNALISCLLLQATPDEVRLILVDPKRVELTTYNGVPHLLRPVVVDVDKVVGVLKWVVHEMDDRYKLFETHSVRNVEAYNKSVANRTGATPLPYIVVIIDELADLMMLAPDDTERLICRLAQLARATGIHLVVATQRPSVDVITGLIKANFPTRISFAVTSQIDSRTILDSPGAEKLLGRGDMLFMPTDASKPIRLQGVYVSDDEIEALCEHWRGLGSANYVEQLVQPASPEESEDEVDDLYEKAVEVAHEHTRISTSLLQRRLRIGYTRAGRLIDLLEQHGIVGPAAGGGRAREVHHEDSSATE